MQYTTIFNLLVLIATPLVSAAATPPPGFHQMGSPCAASQRFNTKGCSLDGTSVLECYPNILLGKALSGQEWASDGLCDDPDEGIVATCQCQPDGTGCTCVSSSVIPSGVDWERSLTRLKVRTT